MDAECKAAVPLVQPAIEWIDLKAIAAAIAIPPKAQGDELPLLGS